MFISLRTVINAAKESEIFVHTPLAAHLVE